MLICGAGALAVAFLARGRRPGTWELALAGWPCGLAAVGTVRAAPWLVALCLAGAVALGTLALVGARTWTGIVLGAASSVARSDAGDRLVPRARSARPCPPATAGNSRLFVTAISVVLLVVFGALFVAADPAFGEMLGRRRRRGRPRRHPPDRHRHARRGRVPARRLPAQRPPTTDALAPAAAARYGQALGWAVPLGLLDLLFAAFVLVQLTVLFGGREHVLETEG